MDLDRTLEGGDRDVDVERRVAVDVDALDDDRALVDGQEDLAELVLVDDVVGARDDPGQR